SLRSKCRRLRFKAVRQSPHRESRPARQKNGGSPHIACRAAGESRRTAFGFAAKVPAARKTSCEITSAYVPGGRARHDLRRYPGRNYYHFRARLRRGFKLSHHRRAQRLARLRPFLASPPLLLGEHQPHQRSGSFVQIKFHAENER